VRAANGAVTEEEAAMADDDKKQNGEKDAGKKGGEDVAAEVVPEAPEGVDIEGAAGEGSGEPEPDHTEANEGSKDTDAGKPEIRPAIGLETLAKMSRGMTGQIHLHFRDRDVVVIGDGGAAAELFDQFANHRAPDAFAPTRASWLSSWFSYDPKELLGVSWYPADLTPERRPVIDPFVPKLA
jgi:hypothetical protein